MGAWPTEMSVMAMSAHTGCNTVYGSTSPTIPTPTMMNSLFQDGVTVGWLNGRELHPSIIARRSVVPERLADILLTRDENVIDAEEYYNLSHFTDALMTDQEVVELPKVWAVGGDGAWATSAIKNMSKVMLQTDPTSC